MLVINVGSKKIGDGHPVFVAAEMAWAHDGSVDKAKIIVKAAAGAGCDAINLHLTSVADYMVPHYGGGKGRVSGSHEGETIYKYLERINLSFDNFSKVIEYAQELRLMVSAMCNDPASLEFAARHHPEIYMIHASCFCDDAFVRAVARKKRPVFIGTGGATLGEIEHAIECIRAEGNLDIVLLHGFQNYPTRLEDVHLRYMGTLKQSFGLPVGYSDHTDGNSDLATIAPIVSIAAGANVLEKHVTHNRALKGEDWESAANPDELKKFVSHLREIEKMFGSAAVRPFSSAQLNYRSVCRKRAVARIDLRKGSALTLENIVFKRSDDGVYPDDIRSLLGKTLTCDLKANDGITWESVR